MGIIDDLAMGLGMKARTEDYDARTARTIARNEGTDIGQSRAAQQYLGGRGYDEGYRPQVAQDDRPFFQRLFTSPESQSSPTPYAIGPIRMNQAIPALGPMGLLMRFMSGGREQEQDPRVTRAIADLQDKSKWMAGYGSDGGRVSVEQDLPTVSPKDYSVYGNIDFPMYIPQAELATGPEYSGRYPQAAYEAGFDDIYLDSLKSRDPENFAFVMRNYGVEGY